MDSFGLTTDLRTIGGMSFDGTIDARSRIPGLLVCS